MGKHDQTAGEKCKAHFELGLIRGKWLLVAYAARSCDNLVNAGGMSVLSLLNIRTVSFLGGVAVSGGGGAGYTATS